MTLVLLLVSLFALQIRSAENCSLSGVVVDSVTGQPLNKVELLLASTKGSTRHDATTTSDSKGHFTLVDLDPGSYHLTGQRNGYVETAYGAQRASIRGTTIQLKAGESLKELTFNLIPAAVISGTIRDSDGEPLADAHVVLARLTYQYGKRSVESFDSTDTDDLGRYRFHGLSAGKYFVGAEPKPKLGTLDHSPKSVVPLDALVHTMYPGVQDFNLAAALQIAAGSRVTGIDITMVRAHVFRVSGRVTNTTGGVARITLIGQKVASRVKDFDLHTVTKNAAGDFELHGVPPGSYLLITEDGSSKRGCIPVEVSNTDVNDVHVVLAPGAEVNGNIAVESDKKPRVAGVKLFFTIDGRQGEMVEVAGDHTFSSRRLRPEHYTIKLFAGLSHEFYMKSIRADDTDVLNEGLTVPQSGSVSLEVVLASDGGRVEGTVLDKDEQPVAGATVVSAPEGARHNRTDLYNDGTTDQYGRFELKSVPPGDYKVSAWDDVEQGAWYDPDFLKDFEKRGELITVRAHGHEITKLHLITASER